MTSSNLTSAIVNLGHFATLNHSFESHFNLENRGKPVSVSTTAAISILIDIAEHKQ